MTSIVDRVTQEMTASGQEASIAYVRQSMTVNPPPRCFSLKVLEEGQACDTEHFYEPISLLEPGQTYVLQVWLDVAPFGHPYPVNIKNSDEIELRLESSDNSNIIIIDKSLRRGLAGELDDTPIEFKLTVDENSPHLNIQLRLYRKTGNLRIAGELQLEINGDYEPLPKELLRESGIDIAPKQNDNVAFLNISAPEVGKVKLWGWQRPGHLLRSEPVESPITDDVYQLRNEMREFSLRNPEAVLNWLRRLKEKNVPHLIVVDLSESDIPWEMMTFGSNEFLGAQIAVSRWVPPYYYGEQRVLTPSPETCHQQVAGYLGENESDEDHPICSSSSLRYHDVPELQQCLDQFPEDLGVLYIGYHDLLQYDNPRVSNKLEQIINSPQTGLYLEIDEMDITDGVLHTLCFVNTKLSGRLFNVSGHLMGLPEVFLRRVSGYIGLIGNIESKNAVQIGKKILKYITVDNNNPVLPSEILRQLRAEAVDRLMQDKRSKDNQTYFRNVFTYVYYGNPLLQVNISGEIEGGYHNE